MDVIETLKDAIRHLRSKMKLEWNRDLPLFELFGDRWERARKLGFGEKTSIYESAYTYGDVKVGESTWIGPMTMLDGSGGLEIGSFCSISSGVQIYSHDTVKWAVSGGKAEYERKPTKIGNDCFIGPGAVIRAGVTIGDRCVVGALSFVNQDLPDGTIVGGVPARVLGRVEIRGDDVKFSYLER